MHTDMFSRVVAPMQNAISKWWASLFRYNFTKIIFLLSKSTMVKWHFVVTMMTLSHHSFRNVFCFQCSLKRKELWGNDKQVAVKRMRGLNTNCMGSKMLRGPVIIPETSEYRALDGGWPFLESQVSWVPTYPPHKKGNRKERQGFLFLSVPDFH